MTQPLRHVVVVLPGIMGSVLRDADGRDVWSTSVGALVGGVLSWGRRVTDLRLPEGIGDDHPGDGVVPAAIMPDLHVIPGIWSVSIGYRDLRRWLGRTFDVVSLEDATDDRVANFVEFAYDWRLSNRYNAARLKATVEPVLERYRAVPGRADTKLVLVAHSMGGLVARYYTDVLGGHEVTHKVITLGTPHRGAVNALDSLVNGVRKGFGPFAVNLTGFARSLPALHQLLPEYACIVGRGGLLKTTETAVPELDTAMAADAMRFHTELEEGARRTAGAFDAHPVLARTQPTATTARIADGRVLPLLTLGEEDQRGDGTVPRLSAAPYGVAADDPILRYVMDKHGNLPGSDVVHVELDGVLTGTGVIPRAPQMEVGVQATDVLLAGESLDVAVTAEPSAVLEVQLLRRVEGAPPGGADAALVERREVRSDGDGTFRTTFAGLPPGGYGLIVRPVGGSEPETVTTPVMVFEPA
jgi:pimeloyl-ACP methyl ester carboxylesterase